MVFVLVRINMKRLIIFARTGVKWWRLINRQTISRVNRLTKLLNQFNIQINHEGFAGI
jgi:hypothetical protein